MKAKAKAPVYLWTGNGWGKTTSALGCAMRALGHGKKVIVIQFMKGRKDIGEYKIQTKIKGYEMHQFGSKQWVNLKKPSEKDKELAKKGFKFAKDIAKNKKPFLLILDEINLAAKIGLLDSKDIIGFLDSVPAEVHVYMTGRYAPAALKKRADFVNTINMLKGPKKLVGEKGIDY